MYLIKYIKYGSEEYNRTLKLRNEVMRKPLGKSIYDEDFSCEENQIVIGAFETNTMVKNMLIGCGVLSDVGQNTFKVEYVCVEKVLQKKGVGTALMQCLEKLAADRGATRIVLDSRVSAIDFYQRFGYVPKGEIFEKAFAPGGHVLMEKQLVALPKEHHHEHSCGCGCGHNHHHDDHHHN